jgi:hypothetical protein
MKDVMLIISFYLFIFFYRKRIEVFRELNSIGSTFHYICRGLEFELQPSYLSILRVKVLVTRLLDQKKRTEVQIIFSFYL